jgi:hypothetical protein
MAAVRNYRTAVFLCPDAGIENLSCAKRWEYSNILIVIALMYTIIQL